MKKITRLFFILFIFTSLISITLATTSQTPTTIPASSLSYKVKVGDSNTYQVTNAKTSTTNYLPGGAFQLENGTLMFFNITVGTEFNVKVVKINQSNSGIPQVFINQTLSLPGKGTFYSGTQYGSGVIFPAFDNQSSAELYYNSTGSIFGSHSSVKITGDFVVMTTDNTFIDGNGVNDTSIYAQEVNWKTGWEEYIHIKSIFTNGTIGVNYQLQLKSSDIVSSIVNFSNGILPLSAGILGLLAIGVIAFAYSKYHGQVNQGNTNISFPKYLQEKTNFSYIRKMGKSKQKRQKAINSEKALHMIDEILEENKLE